jgi:alpha-D-ribose 1-methylphosphonate 5-triphosphate synthase subunit PhnH
MKAKCLLAAAWIAILLVLHQDTWLWTDKTLLLGCVPIGLAYHAGFTVLAAITLFAFTRLIWPKHLEEEEHRLPPGDGGGAH